MAIGPRRVDRHVDAPTATVWRLLVDLDAWPRWGPTVHRAALEDAEELGRGVRGRVWTPVGLSLPFTITEFVPGRRWAWTVAGVPATAHEVRPDGRGCRVRFEVPWWASAYLPVCAVALGRIAEMAATPGG
ncbi:MAG: SRPBCC family protein [Mycobacterium sp.]|nr:SRPBCC family protein [Mycobacterium sp.]